MFIVQQFPNSSDIINLFVNSLYSFTPFSAELTNDAVTQIIDTYNTFLQYIVSTRTLSTVGGNTIFKALGNLIQGITNATEGVIQFNAVNTALTQIATAQLATMDCTSSPITIGGASLTLTVQKVQVSPSTVSFSDGTQSVTFTYPRSYFSTNASCIGIIISLYNSQDFGWTSLPNNIASNVSTVSFPDQTPNSAFLGSISYTINRQSLGHPDRALCATTNDSFWFVNGCSVSSSTDSTVTCSCTQLSPQFAIMERPTFPEDPVPGGGIALLVIFLLLEFGSVAVAYFVQKRHQEKQLDDNFNTKKATFFDKTRSSGNKSL